MGTKTALDAARAHIEELNQYLRAQGTAPVDSKTFCILPFIQYSTTTDGEIRLCCRSRAVGAIAESSLGEMWQGPVMEQVRSDLSEGRRRSECRACWELEDLGMVSLRQGQSIQRALVNKDRVLGWMSQRHLPGPHTLELKLSNLCNLKCRMCSPIASTPWLKEWPQIQEYYNSGDRQSIQESYDFQVQKREPVLDHFLTNPRFIADLAKFSDGIQELEFAGGEPLLDPLHYEVLKGVLPRASEITLKYSTNLMMLGTRRFDVMELWRQFKQVKLTISIDGYPELNEYIRTGTVSSTFEKNLATVQSLPNVELKASTCISTYNALFLRETYEYIVSLGLTWYANRVRSPKFLDARTMPRELREQAIARLRSFDPAIFDRYAIPESIRWKSTRTFEDSLAWLADGRLESIGEFGSFLAYKERLDQVRKTRLPALDKALSLNLRRAEPAHEVHP